MRPSTGGEDAQHQDRLRVLPLLWSHPVDLQEVTDQIRHEDGGTCPVGFEWLRSGVEQASLLICFARGEASVLFSPGLVTSQLGHTPPLTLPGVAIAIMGCIVNGPGRWQSADFWVRDASGTGVLQMALGAASACVPLDY